MKIETRQDKKRGCGWRKEGGLYLMSGGVPAACGKLPLPLTICPTCGGGIHFSRGFTWINPEGLFDGVDCPSHEIDKMDGFEKAGTPCALCPLSNTRLHLMGDKAGLIWIGEKFYSTESFLQEAAEQGVSRRINTVPHDFELGKTWIFLAHKKGIQELKTVKTPGADTTHDPYLYP